MTSVEATPQLDGREAAAGTLPPAAATRERLTLAPSPCADADAERVCTVTHLLLVAERMATPQGREAITRIARAIAHGRHTDAFSTLQPPMENRRDEEASQPGRR
jgi:hypothetical protein